MRVADLHCDLLMYLANKPGRTPENDECRTSFSQFQKGGVYLQTLAVFTETRPDSAQIGERQFQIFQELPLHYPEKCVLKENFKPVVSEKIQFLAAIENASGICAEQERLEEGFARLERYLKKTEVLLYVSLTWNQENRFGGGNLSKTGLKRDGELLLEYLSGKRIAIDFSHTSDALAADIFNFIDKKGLKITPIASHSNFRSVTDHPRNLPDEFAKEIIRRKGIIGLNFVRSFIGTTFPDDFVRQIEHAHGLGAHDSLCLGSDFFYDQDPPVSLSPLRPFFYDQLSHAGCYPTFFNYLSQHMNEKALEKVAHKNFEAFLARIST